VSTYDVKSTLTNWKSLNHSFYYLFCFLRHFKNPEQIEKLEEDRAKRAVHLQHAMEQIKKQLDDHNSGVKNFDERRLKSLTNRLQSYKGQIYDATRTLSPEEIDEMVGGDNEL